MLASTRRPFEGVVVIIKGLCIHAQPRPSRREHDISKRQVIARASRVVLPDLSACFPSSLTQPSEARVKPPPATTYVSVESCPSTELARRARAPKLRSIPIADLVPVSMPHKVKHGSAGEGEDGGAVVVGWYGRAGAWIGG